MMKEFILGCNYWASNAGTEMWVNWDEAAIEQDLRTLSENGLGYLRVFPNWRDFQPVCIHYGPMNGPKEYRMYDGSRPDNPYYLDMEMMRRFQWFCQIASKYGFKLIVGILTGWMSGRCFTPRALEGIDLYKSQRAQHFEQLFIKGFVSYLQNEETIVAWDLGNECNCLTVAEDTEVAAAWTAMVSNAIRAADRKARPVISGMHTLGIDNKWRIEDQAQWCDVLTTHPYPNFVKHCNLDTSLAFRTLMHATCESVYYRDIGAKPCLVEEIGLLGPNYADDDLTAAFLKTNLYSNWANGLMGVMWWCGCEQLNLTTTPYDWNHVERELGLMDIDGKPKKMLDTYREFGAWLKGYGKELPPAVIDGVCLVSQKQDQWGAAFMTYCLAKQAGLNLAFARTMDNAPKSDLYIVPSVNDLYQGDYMKLRERSKEGATLYLSADNVELVEFEKVFGVRIRTTDMSGCASVMKFDGENYEFKRRKRRFISASRAEVLAMDADGIPAITKNAYGNGTIYYVNFPLETMLLDKSNVFEKNYYRIYEQLFAKQISRNIVSVQNTQIGVTHHQKGDDLVAVLINYSGDVQQTGIRIKDGYEVVSCYGGEVDILMPNEAVVVEIKKTIPV